MFSSNPIKKEAIKASGDFVCGMKLIIIVLFPFFVSLHGFTRVTVVTVVTMLRAAVGVIVSIVTVVAKLEGHQPFLPRFLVSVLDSFIQKQAEAVLIDVF